MQAELDAAFVAFRDALGRALSALEPLVPSSAAAAPAAERRQSLGWLWVAAVLPSHTSPLTMAGAKKTVARRAQ